MKTELYSDNKQQVPSTGKHIIGYFEHNTITVYQAYKPSIAEYSIEHQKLGGNGFSYDRMSWIKPGFLWMMYRSGWASKPDQERILAIKLTIANFKKILEQAVPTTYKRDRFLDNDQWQSAIKQSEVRIQWDPDHDPYGRKEERRAIQLGLKGNMLKYFGTEFVLEINDVTNFVQEQKQWVDQHNIKGLRIPVERILKIDEPDLQHKIGLV